MTTPHSISLDQEVCLKYPFHSSFMLIYGLTPRRLADALARRRSEQGIPEDVIAEAIGITIPELTGYEGGFADLGLAQVQAYAQAVDAEVSLSPRPLASPRKK